MLHFFIGAALGLLIVTVWKRLTMEGSVDAAQRIWRDSPRWLRLVALLNLFALVLIVLQVYGAWLVRLGETASGFRVVLGLLFGAVLVLAERGDAQAQPEVGTASGEGARGKSRPAPWWTQRRALLPLGLIALPLLALLAPRGELNLDFVQSVKTPFIEAYFARNETDLHLQLQSEPEGFFRLGSAGLEEAIHMAHAEVLYRETVPGTVDRRDARESEDKELQDARDGLALIENVLQPISQCIHQIDSLYGDRELLSDSLHYVGARLARALLVADKGAEQFQDRTHRSTAAGGIDLSLSDLGSQIASDRSLIALINADDKANYCSDSDREVWRRSLGTAIALYEEHYLESPANLVALLGQPAVVHASAMFFMWSGNPSAAKKIRDRDAVLEMAKHHASILEQAATENELEKVDLQMLEAVCAGADLGDEEGRRRLQLITWIGDRSPADDYALFLDSAGLVRLVDAVAKDDDAGVERALSLFEESLLQGEGDLDTAIALTIREHRDQARRALGLPGF